MCTDISVLSNRNAFLAQVLIHRRYLHLLAMKDPHVKGRIRFVASNTSEKCSTFPAPDETVAGKVTASFGTSILTHRLHSRREGWVVPRGQYILKQLITFSWGCVIFCGPGLIFPFRVQEFLFSAAQA